jgi:hypothetical protein
MTPPLHFTWRLRDKNRYKINRKTILEHTDCIEWSITDNGWKVSTIDTEPCFENYRGTMAFSILVNPKRHRKIKKEVKKFAIKNENVLIHSFIHSFIANDKTIKLKAG